MPQIRVSLTNEQAIELIVKVIHDEDALDHILCYSNDLVFDAKGLMILHESDCLQKFFMIFKTNMSGYIVLDFKDLAPSIENKLLYFLDNNGPIDVEMARYILRKAKVADNINIFRACIYAIKGDNRTSVFAAFNAVLTEWLEEADYGLSEELDDTVIGKYFGIVSDYLTTNEIYMIIELLIKNNRSFDTIPLQDETCVLFSPHYIKKGMKTIFKLACKYNNKLFMRKLMTLFKEYITEEVVKAEINKYTQVVMNISMIYAETK